jgi:hypothetical protein
MEELADQYEPGELNRVGFRLYERFRPEVSTAVMGWAPEATWIFRRCGK